MIPVGFDMQRLIVPPDRHDELHHAFRAAVGLPDAPVVVAFVGRIVPIKRADRFLAAAWELRDTSATFMVVGDGEGLPALRGSDTARALGDRIVFTGYRSDIAAVYHASDVVVLTSDNEGTPVSLIEASACGVPVVGTDVGGVRSVVDDGVTGFVVPADDATSLAARIRCWSTTPPSGTTSARRAGSASRAASRPSAWRPITTVSTARSSPNSRGRAPNRHATRAKVCRRERSGARHPNAHEPGNAEGPADAGPSGSAQGARGGAMKSRIRRSRRADRSDGERGPGDQEGRAGRANVIVQAPVNGRSPEPLVPSVWEPGQADLTASTPFLPP